MKNRLDGRKRGGIAIVFNKHKLTLNEYKIQAGQAEIVAAVGKICGIQRKIVVIATYIPPKTKANQVTELMSKISDTILRVKTDYNDPVILLAGDFNQKNYAAAVEYYPDIKLASQFPTRGQSKLDLMFTNIYEEIRKETRLARLRSSDDKPSDHNVMLFECDLLHSDRFEWIRYNTRPLTPHGRLLFRDKMLKENWSLNEATTSTMADTLDQKLKEMLNECFPIKNHKIRSTDDPWITPKIRRKKEFKKVWRGRSWKELKCQTNEAIRKSKKDFFMKFKEKAEATNDPSLYYKVVRMLKDKERPKHFDIMTLQPGGSEEEVCNELADFFGTISSLFHR